MYKEKRYEYTNKKDIQFRLNGAKLTKKHLLLSDWIFQIVFVFTQNGE